MTGPTLPALFDGVRESAFRWEGLDAYAVGGAEQDRIRAWRAHEPRPVRSIRTNDYLARIARHALADPAIPWERVTRRRLPPTEYQRYRAPGDQESQAAGELVSVLLPGTALDVADDLPGDFWLFNRHRPLAERIVALMHYTDAGAFEGITVLAGGPEPARDARWPGIDVDPERVLAYCGWADDLLEAAVPLNAYLAMLDAGTGQIGA